MNSQTWLEEIGQEYRHDVDFISEVLVLDLNEQIVDRMTARGLRRSDLAQRMGVSKAYITKVLRGNTNLTLRTLVALCLATDAIPTVQLRVHPENLELIDSFRFDQTEDTQYGTPTAIESATVSAIAA